MLICVHQKKLSECIPTQMTLWAMAKSPLMYGGDVRKIDPTTYGLITNPTLLEINSFSSHNMEVCDPSNFFFRGKGHNIFVNLMHFMVLAVSLHCKLEE